METLVVVLQTVVALGIFNVWILRFGKATQWRGGSADSMKAEFDAYGLPGWSVMVIGFLKILFAACLIAGIWFPVLVRPAAIGIAILMLGAVAMHIKVKDPAMKSLPALTMLVMSLVVGFA
ncbi:MAG: DoxX family protein [Thermoanaerobaculales bacterium]|jgi:hypothetical protein|nr:DoxX family protein [Thermoanaerobaculales bacterium]